MSEIEGEDNKKYRPYENSGIKEGDMITKINNIEINSTEQLMKSVNRSQRKTSQNTIQARRTHKRM